MSLDAAGVLLVCLWKEELYRMTQAISRHIQRLPVGCLTPTGIQDKLLTLTVYTMTAVAQPLALALALAVPEA